MSAPMPAGLCDFCRHVRAVEGARTTFVLCGRGLADPAFPKYPRLPVVACAGFEPRATPPPPSSGDEEESP